MFFIFIFNEILYEKQSQTRDFIAILKAWKEKPSSLNIFRMDCPIKLLVVEHLSTGNIYSHTWTIFS